MTSLNQRDIEVIKFHNAKAKKYTAQKKPCTESTVDVVKASKEILVFIGHGEGDTKWKGCAWKLLLIMFCM